MLKEHLRTRGLNPELYTIWYGDNDEVVFPLHNLQGTLVGVLRYRPWGDKKSKNPDLAKYKPSMPKATLGFFGVETLAYPGPVYLVEGVFKAAKLHNLGFCALAILGSDATFLRDQIFLLRQFRGVVGIGDNDAAGKKFVKDVGDGFTTYKDLDELEDDEVRSMIDGYERLI